MCMDGDSQIGTPSLGRFHSITQYKRTLKFSDEKLTVHALNILKLIGINEISGTDSIFETRKSKSWHITHHQQALLF